MCKGCMEILGTKRHPYEDVEVPFGGQPSTFMYIQKEPPGAEQLPQAPMCGSGTVRVTCNEAVNVITTVPGSASQMKGSINF